MAKRNPIDFDTTKPPLAVTDPARADAAARGEAPADPTYPKHLVKPDLEGPGGPASRELKEATSATQEKQLRAQGYMTHHEADVVERKAQGKAAPASRRAKLTPAKKPTNRKPKAAPAAAAADSE